MPEISAKTWNSFVTPNLRVTAEVLGSFHEFDFENYHISVQLPKPEPTGHDGGFKKIAIPVIYRADTNEPLTYAVAEVVVEITVPKTINVPKEALSNPPKQVIYFSEKQKKVVDDVCDKFSGIAIRALLYWLEIIRWVSDDAHIGQPTISGFESGWSTYIKDSSTNHKVWARTGVFTITGGTEITKEHWEKAAIHLQNGDVIPMHLRYLHDAKASTRNEQYEKAIIELAMSCEIYLRYSVFEFIPKSTPDEMKKYIADANINKFVSQFFKTLVLDSQKAQYKHIKINISSLMSRRNSYLHMGNMDDSGDELCRRFTKTTEQLFKIKLVGKANVE